MTILEDSDTWVARRPLSRPDPVLLLTKHHPSNKKKSLVRRLSLAALAASLVLAVLAFIWRTKVSVSNEPPVRQWLSPPVSWARASTSVRRTFESANVHVADTRAKNSAVGIICLMRAPLIQSQAVLLVLRGNRVIPANDMVHDVDYPMSRFPPAGQPASLSLPSLVTSADVMVVACWLATHQLAGFTATVVVSFRHYSLRRPARVCQSGVSYKHFVSLLRRSTRYLRLTLAVFCPVNGDCLRATNLRAIITSDRTLSTRCQSPRAVVFITFWRFLSHELSPNELFQCCSLDNCNFCSMKHYLIGLNTMFMVSLTVLAFLSF